MLFHDVNHSTRNEGLRLIPALPTHLQRAPEAGSGGKVLGETNMYANSKFFPYGHFLIVPTRTCSIVSSPREHRSIFLLSPYIATHATSRPLPMLSFPSAGFPTQKQSLRPTERHSSLSRTVQLIVPENLLRLWSCDISLLFSFDRSTYITYLVKKRHLKFWRQRQIPGFMLSRTASCLGKVSCS